MKKAKTVASVILFAGLAVGALSACAPNVVPEDLTVDFKVMNSENAWAVHKTETVVDGKVTLPEAPAKQYYDFGGWFTTEDFATKFTGTGITESCSAYGKYVAQEVTVYLNGEKVGNKNLIDVVNADYNPGEGLVFSGWYKDAALQVKWNGTDTVSELYASNLALVTFNNGYEDVYTKLVKPGTVITNPAETEVTDFDGNLTTLELNDIVEYYMSEKDVYYVDAEGKAFDFSKPINKSTTITVNWNTKGLNSYVKYNEAKDFYYYEYNKAQSQDPFPALSFQSKATIEVENENKEKVEKTVDVIAYYSNGKVLHNNTKKIIFGEGIKSISAFNGDAANNVEEISLPTTLKVLDNSFNNLPKLKGIELPEGLEVLIGSFFKKTTAMDYYKSFEYGQNHDFEINVPASVKNIALAPTNLKFAKDSKFYKEDGRIFLKEGNEKILISDADNLNNSTIVVPEGVTGIQVGTYHAKFDYLFLPSTFKFVNYNADVTEYPYHVCNEGSESSYSGNFLYDKANAGDEENGLVTAAMSPMAYSISDNLGGANFLGMLKSSRGTVVFANGVPANLNKYAFVGDASGWAVLAGGYQPMDTEALKVNVINKAENKKLHITLRIPFENPFFPFQNYSATVDAQKVADVNALVELIKLGLDEDKIALIDEAIKDKTLAIMSNNEEIQASAIDGGMFVTVVIK